MDWMSFFIGFAIMGGFWLSILAGVCVAYVKGGKKDE